MASSTLLVQRASILRGIREFFWARGFLEVETPVLLAHPSQEPELEPLHTTVRNHRGTAHDGFLRMSPEFSIKKLIPTLPLPTLGGGGVGGGEAVRGVFELGPVFRDGEPWGPTHNPEFTMLEWYRIGADYTALMEDCEALLTELVRRNTGSSAEGSSPPFTPPPHIVGRGGWGGGAPPAAETPALELRYCAQRIDCAPPWERLTVREAWQRYAQLNLDALLTREAMAQACAARGLTVTGSDTFDDLFFKIHLTDVEPRLGRECPTFLLDWPAQMAALARRKPDDPRYAERVELYIGGLEIANGFSELTDAREQRVRFEGDQARRTREDRPVYPLDEDFLHILDRLPPTAGIALGVDRLVMLLVDAATMDEVRWLPASTLWPV